MRISDWSSDVCSSDLEPSASWLALPAVIVWPSPITGLRLESPSSVVSARLHSSLSATTSLKLTSLVSLFQTALVALHAPISSANLPGACAAAASRRSEGGRVGKRGGSQCDSGGSPDKQKKKK